MVEMVRVKLPERVRGWSLWPRSSDRIRTFQPEGEIPLQTRCRCGGLSYNRQAQVAESASPHRRSLETGNAHQ